MDDETKFADIQKCTACACFNLRKATRAMTRVYDEAMRPSGLRGTQFPILAALIMAGPSSISDMAQHLVMDRTTLARNLKPLEKQGMVSISPGKDKRTKLVSLTQKGEDTMANALPMWEKAQNMVVEKMGEDRWQMTLESLLLIPSLFPLDAGAKTGTGTEG
jgi:DNA-binding MarR family transcriptional regulator